MLYSLGLGPSAKVCLSAMFGVGEFKASILYLLGGPLAKVGLSTNFGVAVFKASILNSLGGPLAKVGLSANFCVAGILGISALLLGGGGSICQSMFTCQIWCSGIQGIYSLIHWSWVHKRN